MKMKELEPETAALLQQDPVSPIPVVKSFLIETPLSSPAGLLVPLVTSVSVGFLVYFLKSLCDHDSAHLLRVRLDP